jgi:HEAT repeat protein
MTGCNSDKADTGNVDVDVLIRTLLDGDADWKDRVEAAQLLGKVSDPRATEPLIEVLVEEDCDVDVARAAMDSLGEIGDVEAIEPILRFAGEIMQESPYHIVWTMEALEAAWEALSKMRGEEAVYRLNQALGDESDGVRETAAEALGTMGSPAATESLVEVLSDDEAESVRSAAARALGQIGEVKVVNHLTRALGDECEDVRVAAAEALGRIGDEGAGKKLVEAMEDLSEDVRRAALGALVTMELRRGG